MQIVSSCSGARRACESPLGWHIEQAARSLCGLGDEKIPADATALASSPFGDSADSCKTAVSKTASKTAALQSLKSFSFTARA
jgi:hypothetical protein